MKRLFIATIILSIIASLTFWGLRRKSSVDLGAMGGFLKVSEFDKRMPAAQSGDTQAQYKIAQMYATGDGVKKDLHQAYSWYLKSAAQGFGKSRYELGLMFANGVGVRQDYYAAAKWYRLAATFNNHAGAQFRLGELYFNGRGGEHDYGKAIHFYTLAAGKGHAAAQYLLGAMYEEGWGVPRDLIKAYIWLKLSREHRAEAMAVHRKYDPERKLKSLIGKMNNYQIGEAEKRLAVLKIPR